MAAAGKPLVLTLKSDGNYTMAEALDIDVSSASVDVLTAFNSTTGIDIQTTATFLALTSTHLAAANILLGEAEIVDWSSDQGSTNLHTGNYTDTTYAVADGGLSQNNFTNADHSKLDAIEAAADVTDITNINAAFVDDAALKLGAGDDSHLSYDGTNTNWNLQQVGTGILNVTGGIDVTGCVAVTGCVYVTGVLSPTGGATFTGGNLKLNDDVKIVLGTGNDSQLSYNGTTTLWNLQSVGNGGLSVTGDVTLTGTVDVCGKIGVGTDSPGQAIDVVGTAADTQISMRVDNQDGGATSDARLILKVASTGGDAYVRMFENGGNSWCMGAYTQGSPGTNFRITDHTNLDSNVAMEVDASQDIWMPQTLAVGQSAQAADYVILECESTTKAFLPPRMTTTQRDAIGGGVADPATGSVIYNTTTNVLNFWNGSAWGAV